MTVSYHKYNLCITYIQVTRATDDPEMLNN